MERMLRLSHFHVVDLLIENRFVKFGIVGFSGTLVNFGVLYVFQEFIFAHIEPRSMRLTFSLVVAILLSTANNFFLNRAWTWKDRKQKIRKGLFLQLGQYFLACWFSILLQFASVKILADFLHYLIANIIAIAISSFINFLLNDSFTFSLKRSFAKFTAD